MSAELHCHAERSEASGLGGAKMARSILLLAAGVVALFIAGCARSPLVPKATVLADEPVEWEIQTDGNFPRVRLDLDGGRTAWCLQVGHVRALQLHGARWERFTAAVFPSEFLQYRGVDALLGSPLFVECALQVDYAAQRARLFRHPPPAHAADLVLARFGRDGRRYVAIDIAGQRHWALLDTGFSEAIIVPQRLAQRLSFKAPPLHGVPVRTMYDAREDFGIARIDATVRLGRHEILNPIVLIRSPRPPEAPANLAEPMTFGTNEELVVGSGLLKHFVLTLDQRSGTVVLQRASNAPIITPSVASYGFAVRSREGRVTVEQVAAGSGAEKAGLRPGDQILSVNGTPAQSLPPLMIGELLAQELPLRLEVRRLGREMLIHVPVTIIVQ
jgi:hypothetical protein